jgi:hypothetical protein
MDRREFVRLAGSGMAASAIAETVVSAQQAQSPAAAKVGAQKAAQKFSSRSAPAEAHRSTARNVPSLRRAY